MFDKIEIYNFHMDGISHFFAYAISSEIQEGIRMTERLLSQLDNEDAYSSDFIRDYLLQNIQDIVIEGDMILYQEFQESYEEFKNKVDSSTWINEFKQSAEQKLAEILKEEENE